MMLLADRNVLLHTSIVSRSRHSHAASMCALAVKCNLNRRANSLTGRTASFQRSTEAKNRSAGPSVRAVRSIAAVDDSRMSFSRRRSAGSMVDLSVPGSVRRAEFVWYVSKERSFCPTRRLSVTASTASRSERVCSALTSARMRRRGPPVFTAFTAMTNRCAGWASAVSKKSPSHSKRPRLDPFTHR